MIMEELQMGRLKRVLANKIKIATNYDETIRDLTEFKSLCEEWVALGVKPLGLTGSEDKELRDYLGYDSFLPQFESIIPLDDDINYINDCMPEVIKLIDDVLIILKEKTTVSYQQNNRKKVAFNINNLIGNNAIELSKKIGKLWYKIYDLSKNENFEEIKKFLDMIVMKTIMIIKLSKINPKKVREFFEMKSK